ncbi:MAG: hypothetical protein J7L44_01855 [Candidatus Diapherotrites archaeon]|nr:hypothetical protein [Candidatus Diapherotrites archaeon]
MEHKRMFRVLFVGVTPLGFERFKQKLESDFSGRLVIDVCKRSSDAVELVRNRYYDAVICDITVGQIVKGRKPDIPPFDFLRIVNKINPSALLVITNFHYYQFRKGEGKIPKIRGIEVIDCREAGKIHPLSKLSELIRSLPRRQVSKQELKIPWELRALKHLLRGGVREEVIRMAGMFKDNPELLKAIAMGLSLPKTNLREAIREALSTEARLTERTLANGTQFKTNPSGEMPKRVLNIIVDAWRQIQPRIKRHKRPR